MIKEVDDIPMLPQKTKPSRAASVRADLRAALDGRISKFELAGEIYKPNAIHTTFLQKNLVDWEMWHALTRYIQNALRVNGYEGSTYGNVCFDGRDDCYKIYRYVDKNDERIYVEIYFSLLDSIIDREIRKFRARRDKCLIQTT